MLIIGDVAGIQDFIFDLPAEDTGGQARMLRARSFYVQILAEAIAFRIQRALDLNRGSLLFCAAGKFAIDGSGSADSARAKVMAEHEAIEEWLARETTGALRVSIAVYDEDGSHSTVAERYGAAMAELQRWKLAPWARLGVGDAGEWRPTKLALRSRLKDEEFETFRRIGAALPRAQHLRLVEDPDATLVVRAAEPSFGLPGFRAVLSNGGPTVVPAVLEADLTGGAAHDGGLPNERDRMRSRISRPLARHIPIHHDGSPVWFEDLARMARGAPYLGVLKMDADSLGIAIHERLRGAEDLRELARFSAELDNFFALELTRLLERPEWQSTYTVFSGGDDLLLVGPWDRMLDLAGELRSRFQVRFGASGLTLSGGLAIVRFRYPIRRGAAQAEELLEQAKTIPAVHASEAKDQLATLGQHWKWQDHDRIIEAGKRLAGWVDSGVARRGWLHTLLQSTLSRRGELPGKGGREEPYRSSPHHSRGPHGRVNQRRTGQIMASARLTYHVGRNYPSASSRDPDSQALRAWVDEILEEFDRYETTENPEVLFLPAIVRYALLATRTESPESDE